jgi:hypothetical protein
MPYQSYAHVELSEMNLRKALNFYNKQIDLLGTGFDPLQAVMLIDDVDCLLLRSECKADVNHVFSMKYTLDLTFKMALEEAKNRLSEMKDEFENCHIARF